MPCAGRMAERAKNKRMRRDKPLEVIAQPLDGNDGVDAVAEPIVALLLSSQCAHGIRRMAASRLVTGFVLNAIAACGA